MPDGADGCFTAFWRSQNISKCSGKSGSEVITLNCLQLIILPCNTLSPLLSSIYNPITRHVLAGGPKKPKWRSGDTWLLFLSRVMNSGKSTCFQNKIINPDHLFREMMITLSDSPSFLPGTNWHVVKWHQRLKGVDEETVSCCRDVSTVFS